MLSSAVETEQQFLSGHGSKDAVPWEFVTPEKTGPSSQPAKVAGLQTGAPCIRAGD